MTRRRYATWGWNTVAMIVSIILGFPVYWMILTSVKSSGDIFTSTPRFVPTHFTWQWFSEVFHDPNFFNNLGNSFIITGSTVALALFIGFLGALAIARFRWRGRRVFMFVVLIIQMVPALALVIPLSLQLDNMGLRDTLIGVILVYLMFTMPYTVWTLRTFIANIPRELDEAAMVDGCDRWGVFRRILLPLTLPGLVATGVYCWVQAWNEFVMANVLLTDNSKQTLQIWLLNFQQGTTHGVDWGALMAGGVLTSIPVVAIFMIFQNRIASGLTAGAVKG
jgi:multiple sugar transport system permease protein/N,N'-diacetylchitobiose transport system permease protein